MYYRVLQVISYTKKQRAALGTYTATYEYHRYCHECNLTWHDTLRPCAGCGWPKIERFIFVLVPRPKTLPIHFLDFGDSP